MTATTTTPINWKDLIATGDDFSRPLGRYLEDGCSTGDLKLDSHGGIAAWGGLLVHADGQEPTWDALESTTIDWSGFAEAVEAARRQQ